MSMKLKKVSYVYSEGDAFEKKALDEISLEMTDSLSGSSVIPAPGNLR